MPTRPSAVAAVATTLALGLALVPVTADAAQVQACATVQAPTAATKPWYDFNHTPNPIATLPALVDSAAAAAAAATSGLSPSSSDDEISRAETTLQTNETQLAIVEEQTELAVYGPAYALFAALSASPISAADLTAATTQVTSAITPVGTALDSFDDAFDGWTAAIADQIDHPMTGTVTVPSATVLRATASDLSAAVDTFFKTGSDKVVLQTVNQCTTVNAPDVAVQSIATTYGKPVAVSASVSLSGVPQSGNLVALLDGRPLATPQINGTTSLAIPATLSVGTHYVTTAYSAPGGASPSVAVGTVVVKKAVTSAALKLNHSSVKKGKSAKVTVTVSAPGGVVVPTGKVTVSVNGKKFATKSLSKGKATIALKTSKTGTQKVTVKYAGTGSFAADSSKSKTLTVK